MGMVLYLQLFQAQRLDFNWFHEASIAIPTLFVSGFFNRQACRMAGCGQTTRLRSPRSFDADQGIPCNNA